MNYKMSLILCIEIYLHGFSDTGNQQELGTKSIPVDGCPNWKLSVAVALLNFLHTSRIAFLPPVCLPVCPPSLRLALVFEESSQASV